MIQVLSDKESNPSHQPLLRRPELNGLAGLIRIEQPFQQLNALEPAAA